jgi:hypothetical protein
MAAVLAQVVAWAPAAEAQVLAEGRSLLAEARAEELLVREAVAVAEAAQEAVAEAARAVERVVAAEAAHR